jgi:phosphate transport system substrate-binding protein
LGIILLALCPTAHAEAGGDVDLTPGARERVRFGGSTTVFPYALLAAERYAARTGHPLPIGESTGTTAGARLFCAGIGPLTPDIAMTSRPLSPAEKEACQAHGVRDVVTISIGMDALAVAEKAGMPPLALTRAQIWRALAARVPVEGHFVPNPYRFWRDVDPSLPDLPIKVIGPATTSGKYDALETVILEGGCRGVAEVDAITDKAQRRRTCVTLREDGAYLPHTLLAIPYVERLMQEPGPAIVLMSLQELDDARVTPVRVEGVVPDRDAVIDGRYPVGRALYLHIKRPGVVPGVMDFAREFLRDDAGGPNGYLTAAGLVPLDAQGRATMRALLDAPPAGEPTP